MKLCKNILFITISLIATYCFDINSSEAANKMTTLAQTITTKVKNIRDKIATINPEVDLQQKDAAIREIQQLEQSLQNLETFVRQEKRKNSDFINQMNNEGMPPRVIEEGVEVCFRHNLDAIFLVLDADYNLFNTLVSKEWDIYSAVENLSGPTMTFKNLTPHYKNYVEFVTENKRYSPQEAHVILHIAFYVTDIREALALIDKDAGRFLCNVLQTYVSWLPEATHVGENVEIIMRHSSLISIKDKNNKTMLDWTNDFINQTKAKRETLKQKNIPTIYMDEALRLLQELAMVLKGVIKTDTGKRKLETRDPLKTAKWDFDPATGFPKNYFRQPLTEEEQKAMERVKAINPATEKDLADVYERAQESFPRR